MYMDTHTHTNSETEMGQRGYWTGYRYLKGKGQKWRRKEIFENLPSGVSTRTALYSSAGVEAT